jgi:ABC-type polar amino acid transport system ATPase subunit
MGYFAENTEPQLHLVVWETAKHLAGKPQPAQVQELTNTKLGLTKGNVMANEGNDGRGFGTLIRQFREFEAIKTKLIRVGMLSGDATPAQVEEALRKVLPADAFCKKVRIAE